MLNYLLSSLLLIANAPAQIAPTSPARQRAAERQAQREARHTDAPYKDSHLDPASRGAAARPRVAHEPRFGRNGAPHVARPLLPSLHRRAKTEPKP